MGGLDLIDEQHLAAPEQGQIGGLSGGPADSFERGPEGRGQVSGVDAYQTEQAVAEDDPPVIVDGREPDLGQPDE